MTHLTLSVVGHTNVGKTSLLRTLLRDSQFGEVSPQPSTTVHVSAGSLVWDEHRLDLYDTPGLEDGMGLYEYLQQLNQREQVRHQGSALLNAFLNSPEAKHSFEQEAKVVRQLQRSNAALYVLDVRDPVLPKFQDELAILSYSGKPILPILNFTASDHSYQAAWQQALSELNLHVWVEFDSVTPPQQGENLIYQSLATLLPQYRTTLQSLQQELSARRDQRQHAASQLIAETLVDVAAYKLLISADQPADNATASLKRSVRAREQQCVNSLLRLFNFQPDAIDIPAISIEQGRWQDDLFNPYALKQFGITTSKRAAGGAAIGAGVDVVMLGTTLGVGTLLGASLGGAWQTWQTYGRRLRNKFQGARELSVEDTVVELLATRLQYLTQHLDTRAHANEAKAQIDITTDTQQSMRALLNRARAHPEWSTLPHDQPSVAADLLATKPTRIALLKPSADEQRTELVNNLSDKLTLQRNRSK